MQWCTIPTWAPSRGHLFQRNEARRVCGADTGAAVTDRLVRDGVLAKVSANHLRLWRRETNKEKKD